jgi:hypothetical protein
MKWFKAIPAFCATLLVAVSLAGCAGSSTKESTGGYIDDTVVTTKVKTALFNDKDIKSSEISVQTFKGRVQLSGFVSSAKALNARWKSPAGAGRANGRERFAN